MFFPAADGSNENLDVRYHLRLLKQRLLVPLELPFPPMCLFAVGIEDALDMTVQRPHDADARHHRRSAAAAK